MNTPSEKAAENANAESAVAHQGAMAPTTDNVPAQAQNAIAGDPAANAAGSTQNANANAAPEVNTQPATNQQPAQQPAAQPQATQPVQQPTQPAQQPTQPVTQPAPTQPVTATPTPTQPTQPVQQPAAQPAPTPVAATEPAPAPVTQPAPVQDPAPTPVTQPAPIQEPAPTPVVTQDPTPAPAPATTADPATSDAIALDAANWTTVYEGYGHVTYEGSDIILQPQSATQASETHAALTLANVAKMKDFHLVVTAETVQQLRTGSSPNTWEVFWILFNYQPTATGKNANYFTLKPNGVELGTATDDIGQQFLYTGAANAQAVGVSNEYDITKQGNHVTVKVNGQMVVDYTGAIFDTAGSIGLYCEDSEVKITSVRVTQL